MFLVNTPQLVTNFNLSVNGYYSCPESHLSQGLAELQAVIYDLIIGTQHQSHRGRVHFVLQLLRYADTL